MNDPNADPQIDRYSEQDFSAGPIFRKVDDLGQKHEPEAVHRLSTARVVFANHKLLQHDFPHLRDEQLEQTRPELKNLVGRDKALFIQSLLEDWLKDNVAFISKSQARQDVVNTPIEITQDEVIAFRPPGYGRALVLSLKENQRATPSINHDSTTIVPDGLLDAKGIGVPPTTEPSFKHHWSGLLELGEALREVIFQEVLTKVFRHAKAPFQTVPIYGVLDLGFDAKLKDGFQTPAGMLVRRSHTRAVYQWGLAESGSPEEKAELEVEFLLRKYGITSSGPNITIEISDENGAIQIKYGASIVSYLDHEIELIKKHTGFKGGRKIFEGANIEFTGSVNSNTPELHLVDFGAYRVIKRFEHPVVSLVAHRLVRMGEIISPDSPRYIQPDEEIRLPYKLWGTTGEIFGYRVSTTGLSPLSNLDNPRILAFNLAKEFHEGKLTGKEVRDRLDEYIQTAIPH